MAGRDIPEGLIKFLEEFTISILRKKPHDLWEFGREYFGRSNSAPTGHVTASEDALLNEKQTKNHEGQNWQKTSVSRDSSQKSNSDSEAEVEASQTQQAPANHRRQGIAAEKYNPDQDDEEVKEVSIHPKSHDVMEHLKSVCRNIVLFNDLDDKDLETVITAMFERKATINEDIIVEKTNGDNFYIIESGNYIARITVDGEQKVVKEYDNSGYFGELALMYNAPRSATVTAVTEGVLWALTRDAFRTLVLGNAAKRRREFIAVLNSVQILSNLTGDQQMALADALQRRTYKEGDMIIEEGEPGKEIFFVMSGSVVIKRNDDGGEVILANVEKGGYFGELALLSNSPRAASAIAGTATSLAVLGVESFERLLGPCINLMRENATVYTKKQNAAL